MNHTAGKFLLLAFFIMIGIVYCSKFSNNFFDTMDDDWGIYENPLVQELSTENIIKIWKNETKDMFYIPLTFSSFALDVSIWGNNAKFMKIENLVLLFTSAYLLYNFLSMLGLSVIVTFFTVVLFVIHPMQLESIALPTGRRQILSILFLIPAASNFYKYWFINNKSHYILLGVILFSLSLSAKPSSLAFLPFVVFVYYIEKYWFKRIHLNFSNFLKVFAPIIIIAGFFLWMNQQAGERNFLRQDFHYSIFQHILIVLSSFAIILKKVFIGPYLIFVPIDEYNHFSYFTYIIASGFTVILIGFVFWGLKNKIRCLVYGIAWFLIALIPSSLILLISSDFPMNTSDRYFMLASPGILFVIVYGLFGLIKRKSLLFLSVFVVYILFLSIYQLNFWKNSITLIQHNNSIFPTKDLLYKQAEVYYNNKEFKQAVLSLKEANEIERAESFLSYSFNSIVLAKIANKGGEDSLVEFFVLKALQTDIEDKQLLKSRENDLRQLIDGINFNDDDVDNFNQYNLMKQKIFHQ